MPKHTRIYTRTGDEGTTGLVGGARVRKSSQRIEAYGTVDELSSVIGLARGALAEVRQGETPRARAITYELDRWLGWTQDALFNLGSDLATLPDRRSASMPKIETKDAVALERAIDLAERDLEPLDTFIHPGGSLPGALLHQARTIARRAEREVATLAESEPVAPEVLRYLNRLSDALFVWSRWINRALERQEHRWDPGARPPDGGIESVE
jgi:cob(I)alamin adenosyltransferase